MKVGKFAVIGMGSWSWCRGGEGLLVSARTHSESRYIYIQTFCVHKRNILRFQRHGTYHVVVRGSRTFGSHLKVGGQEFLQNTEAVFLFLWQCLIIS